MINLSTCLKQFTCRQVCFARELCLYINVHVTHVAALNLHLFRHLFYTLEIDSRSFIVVKYPKDHKISMFIFFRNSIVQNIVYTF